MGNKTDSNTKILENLKNPQNWGVIQKYGSWVINDALNVNWFKATRPSICPYLLRNLQPTNHFSPLNDPSISQLLKYFGIFTNFIFLF
jgi:hypothetical protein